MRFRLLGPLEAENDEGLVEFGGIRQRAALAYLLMHSNQVVSTNQLLGALWVGGDAPTTARKILQNAIWRLRGVIAGPTSDSPAPRLLTRSPGYTVQVQAEQLDLLTFQQRVAAGRAALAGGDPQTARVLLNGALSLWRGPVLADLVEEGICWPEATALQNKRVDVMEDRFDAELACGGHQSILHDLKALVAAEPLRERASRQLMLALYRCGRQAEALSVYGRVREELVGGLGLEPSLELQRLQQSVLNQDPALDPPRAPQSLGLPASVTVLRPAREFGGDGADGGPAGSPAGLNPGRAAGQTFGGPSGYTPGGASEHTPRYTPGGAGHTSGGARGHAPGGPSGSIARSASGGTAAGLSHDFPDGTPGVVYDNVGTDEPTAGDAPPPPHTGSAAPAFTAGPGPAPAPPRPASALLVRFGFGPEFGGLPPEDMDRALDALTMLAREKVEAHGGTVASSLGSLLLGLFEDDGQEDPAAVRAARAAAAVRDCLTLPAPPGGPRLPVAEGLSVYGAVCTGRAAPPRNTGGTTTGWSGGGLADDCQAMLASVAAGEIHVCDTTHRLTEAHATYRHACASASAPWELLSVADGPGGPGEVTYGDRECELDLMRSMLSRTRRRSAPHMVTVLGSPGRGRTQLLMEFQRRVEEGETEKVRVLTATAAPAGAGTGGGGARMPADVLAAYCGIRSEEGTMMSSVRLDGAIARLTDDEDTRRRLLPPLRSLLRSAEPVGEESLAAWREFLALAARAEPLVMIWDDLHHADAPLLDALDRTIAELDDVPVLHVVAADDRLLARRPHWSAGHPHTLVISLLPVADDALDRLLESLLLPKRETELAR
ncbi:BTAD domain-containing putative transcriptional regulator [Streptomyces microflavus]|uniref:BTAD domain-containing putative transcriptional regulator n=1 Tax=Streptomyces microflavus TaxID=1919 RepID=UPI002E36675E|nr:BTAD domain-containing putative transcriptional regulator [Streptomyces microflavus]WSS34471.1 AAA family ATPase [Streptomyces microflavus]WST16963.1 AAA family ATPase [Streptomyces microflavus]